MTAPKMRNPEPVGAGAGAEGDQKCTAREGNSTRTNIWWPLYPADYAIDTAHLSLEEKGALIELLNAYWRRGTFLPKDEKVLRTTCGVGKRKFCRIWEALRPMFRETPEGWVHEALERELARARANSEKRRKAANTRWHRERESHANAYANASPKSMQMQCPSPSPSPGTTSLDPPRVGEGDGGEDSEAGRECLAVVRGGAV